jgi:hypothetical protein
MSKTYLKSDHFNESDPMAGPRHWHEEARRQMTWGKEKRALHEQYWVSLAIGYVAKGGARAVRALPDVCFGIVSGRLGHLDP